MLFCRDHASGFVRGTILGSVVALTLSLSVLVASTPAHAATLTTLYEWPGVQSNPGHPRARLVADAAGNLYGTTGAITPGRVPGVYGSVFELSPPTRSNPQWTETTLYLFTGGADGAYPTASLVVGGDGALYGTTQFGGEKPLHPLRGSFLNYGAGVVFRLAPPHARGGVWTEQVLYAFEPGLTAFPRSELLPGAHGEFYGTTQGYDLPYRHGLRPGTVYAVYPPGKQGGRWRELMLYRFGPFGRCGSSGYPQGGLIMDTQGNFYGTTNSDGDSCEGTVFQLVPNASGPWIRNTLHSFAFDLSPPRNSDGEYPQSTLYAGADGSLYGTTQMGGSGINGEQGTVFQMKPPLTSGGQWTENIIYSFNGPDGFWPFAKLTGDASGALYGTTLWGGPIGHGKEPFFGNGVIYKLSPAGPSNWEQTVLFAFPGGYPIEGMSPYGVIRDGSGALFGTTAHGGKYGAGTFFKVTQ